MIFQTGAKITVNNDAGAKSAASRKKRKASDDGAWPGRSSRQQVTTPRRTTRSMLKKINENTSTPVSLDPGLETKPRRRQGPGGGKQATGAATPPQYAVAKDAEAPEQIENTSEPHPPAARRVSEEEVAAATQLARAAVLAGLTMSSPTGESHVFGRPEDRAHPTQQVVGTVAAGVAGDVEAAQDRRPSTQLTTSLPRSTIMPNDSGVDGQPDTHHRSLYNDQSCPVAVAVDEGVEYQATVESAANSLEAATEWPEARVAAREDANDGVTETTKTPGLPGIPSPRTKWSAPGQAQSRDPPAISDRDRPAAIATPPLIRSGGIGGEAENPVQSHSPSGPRLTLPWQPQAIKARYAADVAQIVSPKERHALTGPLPPVALQWEPGRHFVDGQQYSPEVLEDDLEFELDEWDDDVDP
ncbi:hypothetical protein VPNG_01539 [Cytospora leucostoma]|uniref:Uncharacterized protein n=1 Tax=Cytospora leucostoma TaxID=1230097 RepID=A0A423XK97_9PEZI|nr:hypothetical protein VPNG_01539 [Cytospora leucostoma]